VGCRVTIADVAREAGVSQMTVSRVINEKGDVSPRTRQRVAEVIDRLGYRPSGIARSLATKRTGMLGLVVPDVSNPFFSSVALGAEEIAYAQGYHVFLCNTQENPQRELAILKSLEEKRVDGLFLCSSRLDDDELQEVVVRHPNVVLGNRILVGERVRSVLVDDMLGGQMATQHLLATGHQAIGLLAGPENSRSGRRRASGYRAALAETALPYYPAWVRHCAPTVEGGRQGALELLNDFPELTALFCCNDLVAVGALHACGELGMAVPGDVAIVGYDGIPLAELVTPALTTCRVPRYELGSEAVRLLLDQVEGREDEFPEIVLQPELVIRASAPER
jgi:LacI family transcriptional regulator